jgi:hypothetical protein
MSLGRGGIGLVARAAGISEPMVRRGIKELRGRPPEASKRVRKQGGGRKRLEQVDPALVVDLEKLISPDPLGDPESPLRWTCKSLRQPSAALAGMGHAASPEVVARLLHELGYSLQANAKAKGGAQHPDRDPQFAYINQQVKEHLAAQAHVLSVDTKKKELVGEYKNAGQEWEPKGLPVAVNVHDFPNPEVGKAIPYGLYDPAQNSGWVSVGTDHDRASFAVATIRRWWQREGSSQSRSALR